MGLLLVSLRLVRYIGFQVKLGLVRGKYLPACLHAAEASCVSSSSISAFRAAIVRAVWSSKMPLANALAVLNLLDGPVGCAGILLIVLRRNLVSFVCLI